MNSEAKARNAEAVTTYQRISDLFQRHVVSPIYETYVLKALGIVSLKRRAN
jgi:hypothetical protein